MSTRVTRSSARSTPSLDPKTPETGESSPAITRAKRQTPRKGSTLSESRVSKRMKAEEKQEDGDKIVEDTIEATHIETEQLKEEGDSVQTEVRVEEVDIKTTEKPGKGKTSTRKRKVAEVTEEITTEMPLAARTTGLKMFVGAHISSAKGEFALSLV